MLGRERGVTKLPAVRGPLKFGPTCLALKENLTWPLPVTSVQPHIKPPNTLHRCPRVLQSIGVLLPDVLLRLSSKVAPHVLQLVVLTAPLQQT